ncbi:hypothetical protein BGZ67_007431 [Mortierella alpina]|nr:hypothetical protein BGZ67_007431 [Mortierella alpina]
MSESYPDVRARYDIPLHVGAIFATMAISGFGVLLPILFSLTSFKASTTSCIQEVVTAARTFGSGVIISTAFIHMLPSASASLSDPSLPWLFHEEGYTGWAGMIAMVAALSLHFVEFLATQHLFRKEQEVLQVRLLRKHQSTTLQTQPGQCIQGEDRQNSLVHRNQDHEQPKDARTQTEKRPKAVHFSDWRRPLRSQSAATFSTLPADRQRQSNRSFVPIERMEQVYGTAGAITSSTSSGILGEADSLEDERRNPFFTINSRNLDTLCPALYSHIPRRMGLIHSLSDNDPSLHFPNGEILLFNKYTPKDMLPPILESGAYSGRGSHLQDSGIDDAINTDPTITDTRAATAGGSPTMTLIEPQDIVLEQEKRSRLIGTYILEFGIALHSIIIGITLGTIPDTPKFISLLTAILFHQFFEGVALGGRISILDLDRSSLRLWLLSAWFMCSTPLGIAIGIGIRGSYQEMYPKALIIQGVFDACSAGILMYTAMVQLMCAELNANRAFRAKSAWHQAVQFAALWTGAAAMAIVGKWE